VVFELPPDLVLSQVVRLPQIALANLPDAIAYGLPTWSPFDAAEVYAIGSVQQIDAGQALVRIDYALRSKVGPLLARLAATGLAPDRLIFEHEAKRSVPLPSPKLDRLARAWRIDGALASLAVLLSLGLAAVHTTTSSRRLERVEAAIRSELAQLREEEVLRDAYNSLAARRAAVARRRARAISAYELLTALSDELPEPVLVQAIEVADGRGRLEVSGAEPGEILQALRAIRFIADPAVEPTRGTRPFGATFRLARASQ